MTTEHRHLAAIELASVRAGLTGLKGDGEMHLANVAGTVNWLHATGFLFRDDPSDQRSEST